MYRLQRCRRHATRQEFLRTISGAVGAESKTTKRIRAFGSGGAAYLLRPISIGCMMAPILLIWQNLLVLGRYVGGDCIASPVFSVRSYAKKHYGVLRGTTALSPGYIPLPKGCPVEAIAHRPIGPRTISERREQLPNIVPLLLAASGKDGG